jgi:hypothetical protein
MRTARVLLVVAGVLLATYGGWLLLSRQTFAQIEEVAVWAVVGVVLHDAVVAPLALAAGWSAARLLPRTLASAAALILLVIGTLSIVAVPVLVHGTAPQGNATLLDRNYFLGWTTLVVVIIVTGLGGAWLGRRRGRVMGRSPDDGADPGRR